MANIADKLGLTNEVREIKIGKSFGSNGNSCFHTIRYDFKPASVDTKKMAAVDIGEGNQVTVTVPHIEGSGTAQTVFKGSKKPYQKECVLIIDHDTGEITLEKLSCNVQLKKTRAEGNLRNRSITPVENVLSKKSPNQKGSPQKPLWSSSNHHSPVQKCSPLPRSPPNCSQQLSPTNQTSPSMPCLVPPTSNSNPKHSMFTPQEASLNSVENIVHSSTPANPVSRSSTSSQPPSSNVLPSMPKFSQLSEDLQLSESDSD